MADFSSDSSPRVITRIFINADGNVIVSDLWEEIYANLVKEEGGDIVLRD